MFLLPAIFTTIAVYLFIPAGLARTLRDVLIFSSILLFLTGACFLILNYFGFEFSLGNYHGGDGQRFVRPYRGVWIGNHSIGRDGITFYPIRDTPESPLLFSAWHLGRVVNMVILVSPLFLFRRVLSWPKLQNPGKLDPNMPWFLSSLCYLFFIALWNFDSGFPFDFDLMMTMGLILNLYLLRPLLGFFAIRPAWACFLVFAGVVSSWWTVFQYLLPPTG